MVTVLAVDGNSLGHRAYHAPPPDERDGPYVTRVVIGMLGTAWADGPFDAVVVAFDSPDNRRKQLFPEYKANRDGADRDVRTHLDDLRGHLSACGLTVLEASGAEADDLLAATADACVARGWRCTVLSSDRDLLALVSDDVTLLRPRASMSDLRVYDPARVVAEFGVRPDQYTDLAALRGDTSDGLAGVPGVGAKTAARLLSDYGDVPGVYAALTTLAPRLEAALRASRDDVERNLLLMAPIPYLDVDVTTAVDRGVDLDCLTAALTDLGLAAAAARFRFAVERPPAPPLPPPPVDLEPPADVAAPVRAVLAPAPSRAVEPIVAATQDALF